MKTLKTLDVRSRKAWRAWLSKHHDRASEIWLVYHKTHTGGASIGYNESVEEALCFGWVDSLIRRLDDDRYARKFTPRKPGSRWSTANRRRYADLLRRGLLTKAGRQRPPTKRSGDAPRVSTTAIKDTEGALKTHPAAWKVFAGLAPSHQRAYLGWISSAKRLETRERRLREAVRLLATGQTLGLK